MPRDDVNLPFVRAALANDGWQVSNTAYNITYNGRRGLADVSATLLDARLETRQIVVEVKDFRGRSVVADLEQALGQYLLYLSWLKRTEPQRELWLAIDQRAERTIFARPFGQALLEDYPVRLLIIDSANRRIVAWR